MEIIILAKTVGCAKCGRLTVGDSFVDGIGYNVNGPIDVVYQVIGGKCMAVITCGVISFYKGPNNLIYGYQEGVGYYSAIIISSAGATNNPLVLSTANTNVTTSVVFSCDNSGYFIEQVNNILNPTVYCAQFPYPSPYTS